MVIDVYLAAYAVTVLIFVLFAVAVAVLSVVLFAAFLGIRPAVRGLRRAKRRAQQPPVQDPETGKDAESSGGPGPDDAGVGVSPSGDPGRHETPDRPLLEGAA